MGKGIIMKGGGGSEAAGVDILDELIYGADFPANPPVSNSDIYRLGGAITDKSAAIISESVETLTGKPYSRIFLKIKPFMEGFGGITYVELSKGEQDTFILNNLDSGNKGEMFNFFCWYTNEGTLLVRYAANFDFNLKIFKQVRIYASIGIE